MVRLQFNRFQKINDTFCKHGASYIKGFTLIEILIALAIISIALTAIIKATSQNIRSTDYLQSKFSSLITAKYVLSEVQLGLLKPPFDKNNLVEMTTLNQAWFADIEVNDTPVKRIKKVVVSVLQDKDGTPTTTLYGYLYDASN